MEFKLRFLQFCAKNIFIILNFILGRILYRKEKLPEILFRDKLLTYSVKELVNKLRNKEITSTQLVNIYIERIDEVDQYLNAVVQHRYKEALIEAAEVDCKIRKKSGIDLDKLFKKFPILGIPFTVKESCGVRGMSHAVGSTKRLKMTSPISCETVRNLRKAGGIPILVSATPEYCSSIETTTVRNGRCSNPYDLKRTCGGSSGGEGALQASAASPFGIGSDLFGGIRIPCLFNGIFGHKPTADVLRKWGHFPNSFDTKFKEYLQMGPMTRFGSDLALLLHIMGDERTVHMNLLTPLNKKEQKNIKIFYSFGFDGLNGFLHQSVDSDIKAAMQRALKYFKLTGTPTMETKIRHFHNSLEIALSGLFLLSQMPFILTDDYEPPTFQHIFKEFYNSCRYGGSYSKEALFFELMRTTNAFMTKEKMLKYKEKAEVLKREIIELLGKNGVLFFPTFPSPAIHHNWSLLNIWNIDYCMIFNVLGLPTTHIPMGLNKKGLPVGFQIIASPMNDKLCLHLAEKLYKNNVSRWKPPLGQELF